MFFLLMHAATTSPIATLRAVVLSWALTIVNVSVEIPVTLTISAFDEVGEFPEPEGYSTALNGGVGKLAPVPAATTKLVPEVAGDGAVATVDTEKFFV
jgi:hypothetical protein